MEDRCGQFDVTKVPGAFLLAFFTSLTVPLSINRTEPSIIQSLWSRTLSLIVLEREKIQESDDDEREKAVSEKEKKIPSSLDIPHEPRSSV